MRDARRRAGSGHLVTWTIRRRVVDLRSPCLGRRSLTCRSRGRRPARAAVASTRRVPDPAGEVLARRVLEPVDLVEVVVVEAVDAAGCMAHLMSAKSMTQPAVLVDSPATWTATRYEWPWSRAHLWPVGHVRQAVGRLERELLEDLHHGIPRYLWVCRLSRHCGWVEAVLDGGVGVARRGPGRPSAAGRSGRTSRSLERLPGAAPAWGIHELQLVARSQDEFGAGLRAHADPVDAAGAATACRWSRRRPRSPRAWSASIELLRRAGAAARRRCRRRTRCVGCRAAPRRRDRVGEIVRRRETCRRPGRRCRRSRCRRTGRSRSPGAPRGRSRGCSRRSGRRPPAGRRWALALEGVEDLLDQVAHARRASLVRAWGRRRPPRRSPSAAAGTSRSGRRRAPSASGS